MTINFVKKLGWQLYLINPYEHMYENMEDLPKANYLNQVIILNKYKVQCLALNYYIRSQRLYPSSNCLLSLIPEYSHTQYSPGLFSWRL